MREIYEIEGNKALFYPGNNFSLEYVIGRAITLRANANYSVIILVYDDIKTYIGPNTSARDATIAHLAKSKYTPSINSDYYQDVMRARRPEMSR